MKAAVIVFPGSNCDRDAKVALEAASGNPVEMVWHGTHDLPHVDLIVVPGGFSYGDYLRGGAMAAHSPIMREVVDAAGKGVPVLGICNGFQVLTECGLLPGVLMRNATLKFVCKPVHVRVETSQSLFTSGYEEGQVVEIPIAHNEGNYFADEATLDALEAEGRIAFRYTTPAGKVSEDGNPNGSIRNIAGIFNETKSVLGMMPHPERAADELHGGSDGKAMFRGMVEALT
ncbi:MAG: phosphoribosylformylglycinamidine synthase subunit PurQ [Alphaproteobacteria bacterium]|mgnify:CR=1 FL=1|nr:phosphoribosylformylglycinamidine synthase subunit PurQ [Alphaproteobacteria bacterium]